MSMAMQLAAASQEQHRRYHELFGTNPATGDGWRDLSAHLRDVSEQIGAARDTVIATHFSTTVMPNYTAATRADTQPFDRAATTTDTAAHVTDASARINIDGANAITRHATSEASAISAVPDPDSPAGLATILGIIADHQAKSAATVAQAATAETALGEQAAASGTDHNPTDDESRADGDGDGDPRIQLVDDPTITAGPEPEANRRNNQSKAFQDVFGRAPTTAGDWTTAAALDPHSYDPNFNGTPPEIAVARIDPVPGQGVVRSSQFIEQRDVTGWGKRDLGNNRGPDPHFDPEDTKVTTYIDYENGLVVLRQNPSVEQLSDGSSGSVEVGTPTASVTQLDDGSVRIKYDAPNPFPPDAVMDPEGPFGSHRPSVNGDLVFTPGPDGVTIGGTRTDYPSMEVYQDLPDGSTRTILIDPADSGRSLGPAINLPFHHDVGTGGEAFAPFDTGAYNPRYDVQIPIPPTPMGPVTAPPTAAPEPPEGVTYA